MLTDFLNLRTTENWIGYDSVEIIPEIYGTNDITPLQYNTDGTKFVCANHPCQKINRVIIDGYLVNNYQLLNSVDNTGHPVAFLNFTQPVSGTIVVNITGKPLFNAGEIITDFSSITDTDTLKGLQALSHATQRYELAGVLNEKITIRSAIDLIAGNIGFSWNSSAKEFGYLFPEPPPSTLQSLIAEQAQCQASIVDMYNVLTVQYNYSYAQSKYKNAITLVNQDSVKRYGRREATHQAQWVKNKGDADDIGKRLLQYYSQPVWDGTAIFDTIESITEGEWIENSHRLVPITKAFIKSVNDTGLQITCAFEGVKKDTQNIEVESVSVLFEEEIKERVISEGVERVVSVSKQSTSASSIKKTNAISGSLDSQGNGVASLTIVDESGRPLSGASVRLDGSSAKITNAAGKVDLKEGTKGTPYIITVEHPRYHTLETQGTW